jgi:hypothetical protein
MLPLAQYIRVEGGTKTGGTISWRESKMQCASVHGSLD